MSAQHTPTPLTLAELAEMETECEPRIGLDWCSWHPDGLWVARDLRGRIICRAHDYHDLRAALALARQEVASA